MHTRFHQLSPAEGPMQATRHQLIVEWWSVLRVDEDAGATTWEVLDSLESQVMECLGRDPPDVALGERLTAKAALLIAGQIHD